MCAFVIYCSIKQELVIILFYLELSRIQFDILRVLLLLLNKARVKTYTVNPEEKNLIKTVPLLFLF